MVSSRLRVDGDPISTTMSGAPVTCLAVRMSGPGLSTRTADPAPPRRSVVNTTSSGAMNDPSDRMVFQPRPDQEVQVPENPLMPDIRRRRHVVLPVNQLMPLPIVREQQEVVVGQLDARRIRLHSILHHARHSTVVSCERCAGGTIRRKMHRKTDWKIGGDRRDGDADVGTGIAESATPRAGPLTAPPADTPARCSAPSSRR